MVPFLTRITNMLPSNPYSHLDESELCSLSVKISSADRNYLRSIALWHGSISHFTCVLFSKAIQHLKDNGITESYQVDQLNDWLRTFEFSGPGIASSSTSGPGHVPMVGGTAKELCDKTPTTPKQPTNAKSGVGGKGRKGTKKGRAV